MGTCLLHLPACQMATLSVLSWPLNRFIYTDARPRHGSVHLYICSRHDVSVISDVRGVLIL